MKGVDKMEGISENIPIISDTSALYQSSIMESNEMNLSFSPNTLYYGDCLEVMQGFPDECVDLIYLDPPFNSKRQYNEVFKGSGLNIEPQIKAFDDIWEWNKQSAERVEQLKSAVGNPASKVIQGFEMCIPRSEMLSYTSYMAQRLFEMHRILKTTGSIYLHCDPTASHYLKLVMDVIFGKSNFINEIVWCYKSGGAGSKTYARKHDIILFYSKSNTYKFNSIKEKSYQGIGYNKGNKNVRLFEDEHVYNLGPHSLVNLKDWWEIGMLATSSKERLGYPTQKPLPLLERIITASSDIEDIVLDPFCGCGTTIEAARKLNRRGTGIDILPFALRLVNNERLIPNGIQMPVMGVPVDVSTARALADEDAFKYQDWAVSLVDGFAANPKKTGDDGIDGFGVIHHKPDNMDRKAILVQVTGAKGQQRAKYDRLQATVRNYNAAMGVLITQDKQTAQSQWQHKLEPIKMGRTTYDSLQCFSIEEYYQYDRQWQRVLDLPPLANPWTGKLMVASPFQIG